MQPSTRVLELIPGCRWAAWGSQRGWRQRWPLDANGRVCRHPLRRGLRGVLPGTAERRPQAAPAPAAGAADAGELQRAAPAPAAAAGRAAAAPAAAAHGCALRARRRRHAARRCVRGTRTTRCSACVPKQLQFLGMPSVHKPEHTWAVSRAGLEPINEQRVSPANGGAIPPDMLQALSQLGARRLRPCPYGVACWQAVSRHGAWAHMLRRACCPSYISCVACAAMQERHESPAPTTLAQAQQQAADMQSLAALQQLAQNGAGPLASGYCCSCLFLPLRPCLAR